MAPDTTDKTMDVLASVGSLLPDELKHSIGIGERKQQEALLQEIPLFHQKHTLTSLFLFCLLAYNLRRVFCCVAKQQP